MSPDTSGDRVRRLISARRGEQFALANLSKLARDRTSIFPSSPSVYVYIRHFSVRQFTRDGYILMTRHVARYHARRDATAMHARDGRIYRGSIALQTLPGGRINCGWI